MQYLINCLKTNILNSVEFNSILFYFLKISIFLYNIHIVIIINKLNSGICNRVFLYSLNQLLLYIINYLDYILFNIIYYINIEFLYTHK